ncbi:MAG: cytochrome c [bacterium]
MRLKLKRRSRVLVSIIGAISLVAGLTAFISLATQKEDKRPSYTLTKPPESMDQYYPPQAKAPVFLQEMLNVDHAFVAIIVNLQQGDLMAAQGAYQEFAKKYTELSKMIPEWKDYFKAELVEALGKALQSGDPQQIQQAMGKVGGTCGSCHEDNMPATWYRYWWKDFHEISVEDPVSGKEVGFKDYMQMVGGDFVGIGVNLQKGQLDQARKAYQGFESRMEGLKKACEDCHETERRYYVSQDVMDSLTAMGVELTNVKPNPEKIGKLSDEVGKASCGGCHMVHMPAAIVHEAWEEEEKE